MLLASQPRGKPGIASADRAAIDWEWVCVLLTSAAAGCQRVIVDDAAPFATFSPFFSLPRAWPGTLKTTYGPCGRSRGLVVGLVVDGAVNLSATIVADGGSDAIAARLCRCIARCEAMERAASLDVLKVRRLIEQLRYERGMELLEAMVAMLTKVTAV